MDHIKPIGELAQLVLRRYGIHAGDQRATLGQAELRSQPSVERDASCGRSSQQLFAFVEFETQADASTSDDGLLDSTAETVRWDIACPDTVLACPC